MIPHTVRHAANGHVEAVYTLANGQDLQVQGETPDDIKRHLTQYLAALAKAQQDPFPDDVWKLPQPQDLEVDEHFP